MAGFQLSAFRRNAVLTVSTEAGELMLAPAPDPVEVEVGSPEWIDGQTDVSHPVAALLRSRLRIGSE